MPATPLSHHARPPLRVVFDTNVLLSLFAFGGDRFADLRAAVDAGTIVCLTRADCLDELQRVLRSRHITLTDAVREAAFARYAALAERVDGPVASAPTLPRCKDPDDQKFLELARDGGATHLVTLDGALLGTAAATYAATGARVVVPRRLREAL